MPIDQYKTLTAYNADASDFCNQSMIYKGMQYGLTYYTDYMGFIYDNELMQKAGSHRRRLLGLKWSLRSDRGGALIIGALLAVALPSN